MARKSTTPRTKEEVKDFLAEVSNEDAIYVPVRPEPWAIVNHCDANCLAKVEREMGGRVIPGWVIWHMPDHFIEAEYHCIYEDKFGSKVDITPKPDGETRILFVPNPTFVLRSRTPGNIAKALSPVGEPFVGIAHQKHLNLMANWEKAQGFQTRKEAEILAAARAYMNPRERAEQRKKRKK